MRVHRFPVWLFVGIAAVVVAAGLTVFRLQSDRFNADQVQTDNPAVSLGLVYLPVNQTVSDYYGLGVNCGALVTEVSPGSPVEWAGLRVGDVITSFNGVPVNEESPLLGMMRGCPAEDCITMTVWRKSGWGEITIVQ